MITRKLQSAIHALIADISKQTGHTTVEIRNQLQKEYWGDREGEMSLKLKDCQLIDAQLFYEYILDVALTVGVVFGTWVSEEKPFVHPLQWGYDQTGLMKICIKHRVCAITMRGPADIHHCQNIGRGFDRDEVDHTKYAIMPLSREYHNKCHNMGQEAFERKYKVQGVYLTEEEVKQYNI